MIILFVPKNIASANIAKNLIEKFGFVKQAGNEWQKGESHLIQIESESVLDVPCDFDDTIIVLSTHKSKIPGKMLTCHYPGNWGNAEMKGEPKTLNTAPATLLKIIARNMKKESEKIGWPFSLEADHHGPTGKSPIIYVEIGAEEAEWSDELAGKAVANAVVESISEYDRKSKTLSSTLETVFCVGGGHYPAAFTKLILESDLAIGHIAPKYVIDEMDEEMFRQGIGKNVEKVSKVLIDKEGTNSKQKKKIEEFANKFGVVFEYV
ncbi:hypothetical protein HY988_05145 [Candidatus Micrarchaeota archaeon]|nr:hypothetical protein [Candidatus Micrarchaeota archaeon]